MKIRKPPFSIVIGIAFLLVPFFLIPGMLFIASVSDWYSPLRWFHFLSSVDLNIKLLFIGFLVAGVALFMKTRFSWLMAFGFLFGALSINAAFGSIGTIGALQVFLGIVLIVLASFFVVTFFGLSSGSFDDLFFFGVARRSPTTVSVQIKGIESLGLIKNLSNTGCFLEFPESEPMPPIASSLSLGFSDGGWLEGRVVHQRDQGCGLVFANLNNAQKKLISGLLK